MSNLGTPPPVGGRRLRVAALVVAVLIAMAAVSVFYYARMNSPETVARQYVAATAEPGNVGDLRQVSVISQGESAEEITRQLHGSLREAPVEVSKMSVSDGVTPRMKYVVVEGTSGSKPFTTGLTLYSERFGLVWRVGAEWKP